MSFDFSLIPTFTLFGMMLALGMELKTADFTRILSTPLPVCIGFSGQLLVLPVVAFALAYFTPIPEATKIGMVIIAACPGGATSNMFSRYAKGDVALSISLTAASSLIAPFTVPLLVIASFSFADMGMSSLDVSATEMVTTLLLNTALPVFLGMSWLHYSPASAVKYRGYILGTTTVILMFLLIGLAIGTTSTQPDVAGMFARSALAVIALIACTSLYAIASARLAALSKPLTLTLILEIGTQNVNLALVIALSILNKPELLGPTLVYLPFMLLLGGAVVFIGRRGGIQ